MLNSYKILINCTDFTYVILSYLKQIAYSGIFYFSLFATIKLASNIYSSTAFEASFNFSYLIFIYSVSLLVL